MTTRTWCSGGWWHPRRPPRSRHSSTHRSVRSTSSILRSSSRPRVPPLRQRVSWLCLQSRSRVHRWWGLVRDFRFLVRLCRLRWDGKKIWEGGGGELTGDPGVNGVWHWGCQLLISDLMTLDVVAGSSVATTSYDAHPSSSSSTHHHSEPFQPNFWFSSLTRSKGRLVPRPSFPPHHPLRSLSMSKSNLHSFTIHLPRPT